MKESFEELLYELSEYLGVPIEPDVKGGCRLRVEEKFDIQLELDKFKENIVFGARIYELSPGTYRQNVLKSGLKANYKKGYEIGILSFVHKDNYLYIWHQVPLDSTNAENFINHFLLFYDKAYSWNNALESGQLAPENAFEGKKLDKPPMFGMKS